MRERSSDVNWALGEGWRGSTRILLGAVLSDLVVELERYSHDVEVLVRTCGDQRLSMERYLTVSRSVDHMRGLSDSLPARPRNLTTPSSHHWPEYAGHGLAR